MNMTQRMLGAGAAAIAMIPAAAVAQSDREAALAARLEQLEAEVAAMRAELKASRAQPATAAAPAPAPPGAAPAVAATPAGTGATSIKLGGYIKMVASFSHFGGGELAANSLGRDFYLPQTIPVGGPASDSNDFSAKQTRLWVNIATDVAGHTLKGYLETDFQTSPGTQGSERTTNGYNLALRRAFVTIDSITIGQDWSTFQFTGALPESTDFVGDTEGTVFVRQPLIRFSRKLSERATLHISAENAETASALPGAPALTENDDDTLPDVAARLAYATGTLDLSLAGVARQLSVTMPGFDRNVLGWGVSAGGKIGLGSPGGSDVRLLLTYGQGLGRYVGLNFAPDAIVDIAGDRLLRVDNLAASAALHLALSPTVRANIIGSYQKADYPGDLPAGTFAGFNDSAWSGAANLFYSPVAKIDFGVEYRHGVRELVSGARGTLDRIEFAGKYSF